MKNNTVTELDTSNTSETGVGSNPTTTNPTSKPSPSGGKPVSTINVKKQDLSNTSVQSFAKKQGANINIVDEEIIKEVPSKLKYLSNVKNSTTNEVAKPFELEGRTYQMVRAINEKGEKMNAIYCIDQVNESGENRIIPIQEFEKRFAKQDDPTIQENTDNISSSKEKELTSLNLSEFKFFFVNKLTGKVRKFKKPEEVAKASLVDGEVFLSLSQMKTYVHDTLFGSKKKEDLNEDLLGEDGDLQAKAKKLMMTIARKIPQQAIDTIKTNKIAQKEVILAFAEIIGVPRNLLPQIIGSVKAIAKGTTDQQPAPAPTPADIAESNLITKARLTEEVNNNIKATIKVKNIIGKITN